MKKGDKNWLESVEAALAVGQRVTDTLDELNHACEHIVQLLHDASLLLESGSHANTAFLAITALEETAKIHIGMFRNATDSTARRKDPLFRHEEKHNLAASPTLAMGSRLQNAIGEQRMNELIELARNGHFKSIRESAPYVEKVEGHFKLPTVIISKNLARELLLFSVEAFDDALVGYTNQSYELCKTTDLIFSKWKNA